MTPTELIALVRYLTGCSTAQAERFLLKYTSVNAAGKSWLRNDLLRGLSHLGAKES